MLRSLGQSRPLQSIREAREIIGSLDWQPVLQVGDVPFGILMIMVAMWMLSGSTSESDTDDMMAAILLRGLGLGFLFLSITLIAFSDLNSRNLACEIGLFNTGRQLGGLMGVAGL